MADVIDGTPPSVGAGDSVEIGIQHYHNKITGLLTIRKVSVADQPVNRQALLELKARAQEARATAEAQIISTTNRANAEITRQHANIAQCDGTIAECDAALAALDTVEAKVAEPAEL